MSLAQRRVQDLSTLVEVTRGNAALGVLTLQNVGSLSSQYGLGVSGAALAEFSRRVAGLLRPCDQMLPLSEDRVCVVFDELLDDNHVLLAGLKIERAFEETFTYQGNSTALVVRAGFVYFGKQERLRDLRPEDLYRFAETARERAVQKKVVFEVSSEEAFARMQQDWETDKLLGDALSQHELTLDYQPKYRLADGALVGAEALVRWRRGGVIIPPQDFMGALTDGRLWDLNLYVLRRAVRQILESAVELPVAINVHPVVLDNPSFLRTLKSELNIWGIAPGRLALEISHPRFDDPKMIAQLNELRSLGVGVAIDQFGTGSVSLEGFPNLPADEIKIARALISHIADHPDDQHLTRTIIDLAHRFSRTVVADGVDDVETFAFLSEAGCDIGQGFYLGAPLNETQFEVLLGEVA
ncbi:MAG: EAL domain-containing protein [Pseudomonadales bacterium]|nr:EAL domain-containing protein [Pseudomonadales bacterium]